MISPREILLGFFLPALVCVLFGALATRLQEGALRRFVQGLALALPCCLSSYAISGFVPLVDALVSAAQLVPLLVLPVAALGAIVPRATPLLASIGLLGLLFGRLGAAPIWPERGLAMLALGLAWSASRGSDARRAWRPLLALGIFAAGVGSACLCGRSAALALNCGGLGASIGAGLLVSLGKPAWSPGAPGRDVAVFALGGMLACAVYLGSLDPWAALALLASLAATRLPSFAQALSAQLALSALALWRAWPAGGLAS